MKIYTRNRARAYARRSKNQQVYYWRDLVAGQVIFGAFRGEQTLYLLSRDNVAAWDHTPSYGYRDPEKAFRHYRRRMWARNAKEAELIMLLSTEDPSANIAG